MNNFASMLEYIYKKEVPDISVRKILQHFTNGAKLTYLDELVLSENYIDAMMECFKYNKTLKFPRFLIPYLVEESIRETLDDTQYHVLLTTINLSRNDSEYLIQVLESKGMIDNILLFLSSKHIFMNVNPERLSTKQILFYINNISAKPELLDYIIEHLTVDEMIKVFVLNPNMKIGKRTTNYITNLTSLEFNRIIRALQ